MSKHTPGPWRVAGQGNGKQELCIFGPNGEISCIRANAHLGDAHLIAAAPETLKELESLVYFCQRLYEYANLPEVWHTNLGLQLNSAEPAIMKATGG